MRVYKTRYAGTLMNSDREGLINTRTTFAVRCRRTGQHEFTSQEMAAFAGSVILKNTGASVDLGNPDMEIHIEVRDQETYIYHRVIPGPGGSSCRHPGKGGCTSLGGVLIHRLQLTS